MFDVPAELETAVKIALEAGVLVKTYHGTDLKVDSKTGNEPVTEADRAASELIVKRLSEAFPTDAILSEESPDDGSHQNDRVWMVDPIDGTKDFIRGEHGFAVMIGLAVKGRPLLGVVSQPTKGFTYAGQVGLGAFKQDANGNRALDQGRPLGRPDTNSHRRLEIPPVAGD